MLKKISLIFLIVLGLIAVGTSTSFAIPFTVNTGGGQFTVNTGPLPLRNGNHIFMNFDNLSIKGDVTLDKYNNWIELTSFQWGVGRTIASSTTGSADRQASNPSISEITVTKSMDMSSPKLLEQALAGEGKHVKIDFVKIQGGKPPVAFAEYDLANTLISGYSVSSGGDRPTESLSLNFAKISYQFIQSTDESPNLVCYDTTSGHLC